MQWTVRLGDNDSCWYSGPGDLQGWSLEGGLVFGGMLACSHTAVPFSRSCHLSGAQAVRQAAEGACGRGMLSLTGDSFTVTALPRWVNKAIDHPSPHEVSKCLFNTIPESRILLATGMLTWRRCQDGRKPPGGLEPCCIPDAHPAQGLPLPGWLGPP